MVKLCWNDGEVVVKWGEVVVKWGRSGGEVVVK